MNRSKVIPANAGIRSDSRIRGNDICRVYYRSPIGCLELSASAGAVTSISFAPRVPKSAARPKNAALARCARELGEYFAGRRTKFGFPVALKGTAFQVRVWKHLRRVPYGTRLSYSELARRAGNRKAVRAVASAVARNPFAVVIPCHRVVPKSGGTGKYAWGPRIKERLLSREKSRP